MKRLPEKESTSDNKLWQVIWSRYEISTDNAFGMMRRKKESQREDECLVTTWSTPPVAARWWEEDQLFYLRALFQDLRHLTIFRFCAQLLLLHKSFKNGAEINNREVKGKKKQVRELRVPLKQETNYWQAQCTRATIYSFAIGEEEAGNGLQFSRHF